MRLEFVRVGAEPAGDRVGALVGVRLRLVHQARRDHLRRPRVVLGEPGGGGAAVVGHPVGAAVADPADDQQAGRDDRADAGAGRARSGAGARAPGPAGSSASALTASEAARIASCMACCGCVPRGSGVQQRLAGRAGRPPRRVVGAVAEETPSQTIGDHGGRAVGQEAVGDGERVLVAVVAQPPVADRGDRGRAPAPCGRVRAAGRARSARSSRRVDAGPRRQATQQLRRRRGGRRGRAPGVGAGGAERGGSAGVAGLGGELGAGVGASAYRGPAARGGGQRAAGRAPDPCGLRLPDGRRPGRVGRPAASAAGVAGRRRRRAAAARGRGRCRRSAARPPARWRHGASRSWRCVGWPAGRAGTARQVVPARTAEHGRPPPAAPRSGSGRSTGQLTGHLRHRSHPRPGAEAVGPLHQFDPLLPCCASRASTRYERSRPKRRPRSSRPLPSSTVRGTARRRGRTLATGEHPVQRAAQHLGRQLLPCGPRRGRAGQRLDLARGGRQVRSSQERARFGRGRGAAAAAGPAPPPPAPPCSGWTTRAPTPAPARRRPGRPPRAAPGPGRRRR